MIYLSETLISNQPRNWCEITEEIEKVVYLVEKGDYVQPMKPYLRYRDMGNRIIAMPAYLGGKFDIAGIKWIASFPRNRFRELPRAHSITILNNAETGVPECIINSSLISAIRTAGVSGMMVTKLLEKRLWKGIIVGIIGFGVIGKMHLEMISYLFGHEIACIKVFDTSKVNVDEIEISLRDRLVICKTWNEAYCDSDIIFTCTVSDSRYIDKAPKKGSLQFNISLRDYVPHLRKYMDVIVVDNWIEVCRENTDIERMHQEQNLQRMDVFELFELVAGNRVSEVKDKDTVMFNPMGMAVFDLSIGSYYCKLAKERNIGAMFD